MPPTELNSSYLGRLAYLQGISAAKLVRYVTGSRSLLFRDFDKVNFSPILQESNNNTSISLTNSLFATTQHKLGALLVDESYSVCPLCFEKKKYLSLEARLSYYVVCPIHHIQLRQFCRCGKPIQPERFDYSAQMSPLCPHCKSLLMHQEALPSPVPLIQEALTTLTWPERAQQLRPHTKEQLIAGIRLMIQLSTSILRRSNELKTLPAPFNGRCYDERRAILKKASNWLEGDWPESLLRDLKSVATFLSFQESSLQGHERWIIESLPRNLMSTNYYLSKNKNFNKIGSEQRTSLDILRDCFLAVFHVSKKNDRFVAFRNFMLLAFVILSPLVNFNTLKHLTVEDASKVENSLWLFFLADYIQLRKKLKINSPYMFTSAYGTTLSHFADIRYGHELRLFSIPKLRKLRSHRRALLRIYTGSSSFKDTYSPVAFITYLALVAYGRARSSEEQ